MRIKVKGWSIDISTLFRVEWRLPVPKIYLHEKFETIAKWASRTVVAFGIVVSFFALPTFIDVGVAIILLGFEVLIEKIIFEYSVMIIQPLPDFKVDESQWITNGYLFPNPAYKEEYNLQNHFGPAYKEADYGRKFFNYLKSWNRMSDDDVDNNICLSFVLEEDNSYTTYLYANPNRKWIDEAFNAYWELNKYEKYGKIQQSMVMQMVYWNTLPYMKGTLFHSFISVQNENSLFYFCPFVYDKKKTSALEDMIIKKYHYSFRKRQDISKSDIEFYYGPTIKIDIKKKRELPVNPQKEINKLFERELNELLDLAQSIEFSLSDNYQKSPPSISVVFDDYETAYNSYKRVMSRYTNSNATAIIKKKKNGLVLELKEMEQFTSETGALDYDEKSYKRFRGSEQAKAGIVLLFGFKNEDQTIIAATQREFSPLLVRKTKFK